MLSTNPRMVEGTTDLLPNQTGERFSPSGPDTRSLSSTKMLMTSERYISPSTFRNNLQIQFKTIPQKPAPEIDEEKLAAARSYVRGTGLQITPV